MQSQGQKERNHSTGIGPARQWCQANLSTFGCQNGCQIALGTATAIHKKCSLKDKKSAITALALVLRVGSAKPT
jgi:hypothetical protein